MRRFIDEHRQTFWVESICKVFQIAPSGYWNMQTANEILVCAVLVLLPVSNVLSKYKLFGTRTNESTVPTKYGRP